MGQMTELWQLRDLRQGLHDLIETIESGDLEPLDPCERLDLWQYLCGVSNRLHLVERALDGERPPSVQAVPSPRAADISSRTATQQLPGPAAILGQPGPGARGEPRLEVALELGLGARRPDHDLERRRR